MRLKSDFIDVIQQFIDRSNYKYKFQLIELNQYHTNKIPITSASHYLFKSGAIFILYGRIRKRRINNKDHNILDLNGAVSHKKTTEKIRKELSADFSNTLPSRFMMTIEKDVLVFEVSAKIIGLVAQYIIGMATLISGDFVYSIQLFEDIKKNIDSWPEQLRTVKTIKTKLPHRLTVSYQAQIDLLYNSWYNTREKQYLIELEKFVDSLLSISPNDYYGLVIKPICSFVIRRDVREARKYINKCKNIKDPTWMYSDAFLAAYEGKLETAINKYKKAFKRKLNDPSIPIQTEHFIEEVIAEEPEKSYLYYYLGLINIHVKEDKAAALRDFQTFINIVKDSVYTTLIDDLREINTEEI